MRIENKKHRISSITIERATYPSGQGPIRLAYPEGAAPCMLIAGRRVIDFRMMLHNLWRAVRFLPPYPTSENRRREDQIL